MDDWRLDPANEKRFRDAVFERKVYIQPSPEWDHDHCAFCSVRFAQEGSRPAAADPGALTEGYSTPGPPSEPKDDYYWVCPTCFEDFRERLEWTTRPSEGDRDST
jgi:hypothetical protein